jgi:hypothetical protein
MYRISPDGHEPVIDVDQVEAIEPAIRSSNPGRYPVDEISSDPLPSGHTSRPWGIGINRNDGSVTLDRDPWDAWFLAVQISLVIGGEGSTEIGDMDRDEAIKLLNGGKQGIDEWNRRRKAGEGIPYLSEADLRRADLSRANLSGAYLSEANLRRANLNRANLRAATLSMADLIEADLIETYLMAADLRGANLRGADLNRAIVVGFGQLLAEFDPRKDGLDSVKRATADDPASNRQRGCLSSIHEPFVL